MDVQFAEVLMRGEVLSGVERRRRWSAQQKLQVACASWEPAT